MALCHISSESAVCFGFARRRTRKLHEIGTYHGQSIRPSLTSFLRCNVFGLLFLIVFASTFAFAQPISNDAASAAITNFTWTPDEGKENVVCLEGSSLAPSGAMVLSPLGAADPVYGPTGGRCLYKTPIRFTKLQPNSPVRYFSTMFSFSIDGYRSGVNLTGHGFTFFIGPDNTSLGDPGFLLGWLTLKENNNRSNHNFAVEFDLHQDSAVFDVDSNHVGINCNSLASRSVTSLYQAGIDLTSYDVINRMFYAWIDYDGQMIQVRLSSDRNNPGNSVISAALDLHSILLDTMYVGFTSSTGSNLTNAQTIVHDWTFRTYQISKAGVPWAVIWIGVTGALFVAVILFILLLYFRTKRIVILERNIAELQYLDYGAHEFTYKELLVATNRFSANEILGRGSSGTVYKGTLSSARIQKLQGKVASEANSLVAVKRINNKSGHGVKEYVAEVKVIGRLRHVNLVRLLGWCHERGELLLVYEYMPNGNLYDFIKQSNKAQGRLLEGEALISSLIWTMRLDILRGVAAALVFLHEECEDRVVHRDVKSSNVMLDSDFNARLGDFGLARSHERNDEYHVTGVAGTIGYMAPECVVTGYTTCKSDVYSFGALALEVATGRRPTDGEDGLVRWVWEHQPEGRLLDTTDARLGTNYNKDEMEKVLKVALFCCLPDPAARPTMRQVQTVLQGESPILSLPLPPPPDFFRFPQGNLAPSMTESQSCSFGEEVSNHEEGFSREVDILFIDSR